MTKLEKDELQTRWDGLYWIFITESLGYWIQTHELFCKQL